ETTGESIRWLVAEHRDLVDAEFALNTDGGGGDYRDGKPIRFNVQAAEKVYQSFTLEVRNKGGHSSRPVPDNAIYHLARGLARLADYQFPVRLNEVTRAFFSRGAAAESPALAAHAERHGTGRVPGTEVLARRAGGARDVHRSERRPLYPERRDPDVRRRGSLRRHQRFAGPRSRRAGRRQGVSPVGGVLV